MTSSAPVTEVFVGVGSNVERERRIPEGLRALRRQFGLLQVSPVYETAAVGFDGNPFFNFVVSFGCRLSPRSLIEALRTIEQLCGRLPDSPKFAPRPLDLDLLLFGDLVLEEADLHLPRPDILQYGFALKPLADLVPDRCHPVLGYSYSALWAQFDGAGMDLCRVSLPDTTDERVFR